MALFPLLRDSHVQVSDKVEFCMRNGVVVNTLKDEYLSDCETEVMVVTTRSI